MKEVFSKFEISTHPPSLRDAPRPVLGGVKNAKNGFIGAQLRLNEPIFGKIPPSPQAGKGDKGGWGCVLRTHRFFDFEKAISFFADLRGNSAGYSALS